MLMVRVVLQWRVRCTAVLAAHHTDSGSRCSTKQPIDADFLVNGRPMNAKTTTGDLLVIGILLRRIQKPWIASKWNRNSSAILKLATRRSSLKLTFMIRAPVLTIKLLPCLHNHSPIGTHKPLNFSKLCRFDSQA